ncbi:MAG: hypothetical protein M0R40_07075 [Firmicutes bacterium]|nr:hypothetical protein [Bacillota bacterium]
MAVRMCPKCSEENLSTAVVCINCGALLPKFEETAGEEDRVLPSEEAKKNKRFTGNWLVATLLLAILIALALLLIKFAVR